MIGKIVTGKSFKGAVEYVMNKPGARLLTCDGVDTTDVRSVTSSFNFQRQARPEIKKVVGHISLSFHPDDAPRLTDEMMIRLSGKYMERMGITDTQYIVVRHTDTEHPHVHIIYNRVRYDRKLVPDNNERRRNTKVCKALKQQYGLTFSEGKQNVKIEKLRGPDQVKYAIFGAIKETLPDCLSVEALADELKRQGIATTFVHRGGDPAKEVQGLTFTKDGQTFKASQVDRKFSYANLCKTIGENKTRFESPSMTEFVKYFLGEPYDPAKLNPEDAAKIAESERKERSAKEHRQEIETSRRITEIEGRRLTPEEQQKLYSPQGLTLISRKNGSERTICYRPFGQENGPDILTHEILSERKISTNPLLGGVQLTDEQVRKIEDGQYIYMENMKREDGTLFSSYVVCDDRFQKAFYFQQPPDRMVKYGLYEMRLMDKTLIEAGFIARAVVKWDSYGQTARPYLWKENPTDTTYKESWNNPRKQKLSIEEDIHVRDYYPANKKSRGHKL